MNKETALHTAAAIKVFNDAAERYESMFMSVAGYAAALDCFIEAVQPPDARILDVACGPGNISRYLLERRSQWQLTGVDLAPNMLELARKNNPGAQFDCMDARAISQLNKGFDGIVLGFCLPYLSRAEAVQLIADAVALLNAGGVLYISTMEDANERSGWETSSSGNSMFMNYHEAAYLKAAMELNGCTLKYEARQPYERGTVTLTDLLLVAVKS